MQFQFTVPCEPKLIEHLAREEVTLPSVDVTVNAKQLAQLERKFPDIDWSTLQIVKDGRVLAGARKVRKKRRKQRPMGTGHYPLRYPNDRKKQIAHAQASKPAIQRASGSYTDIAREYGVSWQTVDTYKKQYKQELDERKPAKIGVV